MPLCSLNEHWGVAQKAARAAGLDWGLAEETARGCAMLAAYRLPFLWHWVLTERRRKMLVAPLASLAPLTSPIPQWSQRDASRALRALHGDGGRALCPLWSGVLLADGASCCDLPWRLRDVAAPLLLLPFMMRAATAKRAHAMKKNLGLRVSWAGATLYTDGKNLWCRSASPNLQVRRADVRVALSALPQYSPRAVQTGAAFISAAAWREMQSLAAQTLVAASAASRHGAGAGDVDND